MSAETQEAAADSSRSAPQGLPLKVAPRPRWWQVLRWVDWQVNTQYVSAADTGMVRVRNDRHPLQDPGSARISTRGMLYVAADAAVLFFLGAWLVFGSRCSLLAQVSAGLLLLWGLRTNWRLRFCRPRALEEQLARMLASFGVSLALHAGGCLAAALVLAASALVMTTWALVGFAQDPR